MEQVASSQSHESRLYTIIKISQDGKCVEKRENFSTRIAIRKLSPTFRLRSNRPFHY